MDTTHTIESVIEQLRAGKDLARGQAKWVFDRMMSGDVDERDFKALLTALVDKGESVDELVGAAEAMRAKVVRINCDAECIDTCGTGGDGISTYNVSTTAAIIAAAAGATVAKHGNRSTSRVSGSTEVLTELGIDVEADVEVVERCLREARIGYLNARNLHPAMKHAAPIRQALPFRTTFNLLGPLTNPAGARRQVLGVPRPELVEKLGRALLELGAKHAWVVHGDGLCDLTVTGSTTVVEVREGELRRFAVDPKDVGLGRASMDDLLVSSPKASAEAVLRILDGEAGPKRDHALLNAGAALVVAGVATDLGVGVALASEAIDDGRARETLDRWRSLGGVGSAGGHRSESPS